MAVHQGHAVWGDHFFAPCYRPDDFIHLFSESYNFVKELLAPLTALSPIQAFGGVGIAALMAVALIIFLCFLVGLVIRMAWVPRMLERLDSYFLVNIPFYAFFRSLLCEMSGRQPAGLAYALAWIDECWQPAVVMEELENGWLAVFIPRVPNPFSGVLCYMPPDRVKRIETSSGAILKSMARSASAPAPCSKANSRSMP